jgi:hypothetical protein
MLLVEKNRVSKITQVNNALMYVAVELQDQLTQSFDQRQLPLGNWYTTDQPYSLSIGGAQGHEDKLTVELASLGDKEGRPTYRYYVEDKDGNVLETQADIHGGVDERPDTGKAMNALVSFLIAACDAYVSETSMGRKSENIDIVSRRTAEWAYQVSDAMPRS